MSLHATRPSRGFFGALTHAIVARRSQAQLEQEIAHLDNHLRDDVGLPRRMQIKFDIRNHGGAGLPFSLSEWR